jgi:hypothetical protein
MARQRQFQSDMRGTGSQQWCVVFSGVCGEVASEWRAVIWHREDHRRGTPTRTRRADGTTQFRQRGCGCARHDGVERHHPPSEDGIRANWFGQVSAWGACAYGTCGRTRRGGAGCDWTKVLGASGMRALQRRFSVVRCR